MSDIPFDLNAPARFDAVKNAFMDNFKDGGELGAAFAVYQHGEPLIDLKGGWADRKKTKPFAEDTLVAVFSSGKAVAAMIIAYLADQNRLSYTMPVATLWPELDHHGIGDLTIGQIMSHQSGLSGITNPYFRSDDWLKWEVVIGELEAQEPLYTPGSASGYHPVTFGFFAGEIARRADEFGRNLGQILREEICQPHTLDIWLGLPESEHGRCADMLKPRRMAEFGEITDAARAAFMQPWSSPGGVSKEAWREAQLAGSNCHATATSLARMMQMCVDGTVNGEKYLNDDMVKNLRRERISGQDKVLPFELSVAAGLMRNSPNFFYGPNPNTVGHSGWGGSCVFADPDTGLSACYAMTRQDNSLMGDPRSLRLIEALYEAL